MVGGVLERFNEAERVAIAAYAEGRAEHEPSITDRLLGGIEMALNGYTEHGVVWRAKTLTYLGHDAQETRIGADFAAVLNVDVRGVRLSTGFLAQAKRIKPGQVLSPKEWERFRRQCGFMLRITPAAYAFLYSKKGISIVPAAAVATSTRRGLYSLVHMAYAHFFRDHLASFLGDHRLVEPTIGAVERLTEPMEDAADRLMRDQVAERVISIKAEEVSEDEGSDGLPGET
jgi:hypothetical protein